MPKNTKVGAGKQKKDALETSNKKLSKPFPDYTIEESLVIPRALKEFNAGNPWAPEEIANTQHISYKSTSFFYLTSASRAYGFTTGTKQAQKIELTALGRELVYAPSPEIEYKCIVSAFNNIQILKDVFEYYKTSQLPDKQYLSNTLESAFKLAPQFHDEFIKLYTNNLIFISKYDIKDGISSIQNKLNSKSSNNNDVQIPPGAKVLFVIMPFTEKTEMYPKGFFSEMFNSLIVPAASEAGYIPKTANKFGSDIIHATIVNEINSADIILADLTEHNPNVLFELGLAIAFKKKVVLVRAKGTKQIFDIDNMLRVFDYDPNLWKSTLERDVPNMTAHILSTNENTDVSYLELLMKNSVS